MKAHKSEYLDKLRARVNALGSPKTVVKDSEGYYQPSTDKTGSGSAILRFLPALPDEDFPFIQIFNHAFQSASGKWFIDNCPTTLKDHCPVCDSNSALWNGPNKDLASKRKRKLYYISNVLVVADPKMPENDGKVFLYKFGVKIMGKINDAINQPFGDAEPIDPFDAEHGANFRLRIMRSNGFPDYDKSTFDSSSPIGDEGVIASVLSKRRSLADIVDPSQFKSYDDLKRKFDQIVGVAKAA